MRKSALVVALLAALAGCDSGYQMAVNNTTKTVESEAISEDQKLFDLVEQHFQDELKLHPINGVYIGDYRFNDQFVNDLSEQYLEARHQLNTSYLAQVNSIDRAALSPERQVTYDIFKRDRQMALVQETFPERYLPFNQFYSLMSTMAQLGSGQGAQPFKDADNYRQFAKRLEGFIGWLDSAKLRLEEGVENKVVLPRILVKRILPQLEAQIVDNVEDSIFYQPILNMPAAIDKAEQQKLTEQYRQLLTGQLKPAYQRLYDYLANDYINAARGTAGYGALPNGDKWYQFMANYHTTTQMPVAEIHQVGLDEVARILKEMDKVRQQVKFDGDLPAFFDHLSSDERYFFTEKQDLVDGYMALKDKIEAVLPAYFDTMPKTPYEVKPVEAFREKSAAGASYDAGSPDGTRPGIFYINTYNLKAQPKWGMTTLSLHEAAPGHHFQISLKQELGDLPSFQRFGGYTAFEEGWALYAEYLGIEMGLFTDPYQYFGKLSDEMLRAMRLVVDTGLHGMGWSREQAIQYMLDNSAMAKSDVVAEVERYMALPGQALSYKIGQLKIIELRERAQQALGDKFSNSEFHNQVLTDGSLPMAVLEAKIDAWIAAKQG